MDDGHVDYLSFLLTIILCTLLMYLIRRLLRNVPESTGAPEQENHARDWLPYSIFYRNGS